MRMVLREPVRGATLITGSRSSTISDVSPLTKRHGNVPNATLARSASGDSPALIASSATLRRFSSPHIADRPPIPLNVRLLIISALLGAGPLATKAHAQASTSGGTTNTQTPSASPDPVASSTPSSASGNGDIVVTAQRRSERLNDVGISIVASSGDELVSKGIKSTEDLAKIVPGLTATQTPYGTPVLTMRGVGFYESSLAASSPIATYLDEIPLPYTRMAIGATMDLQRVEVLKGPQGTLYGQNTTGGAINYIVNKPTDVFHAGFDASLGRFMDTDVQGFVSGPITDTLEYRIAGRSHQSDGWQESVSRPGDTLGATRFVEGRVLLDWQASSALKLDLNINGFRDRSDNPAVAATSFQPNIPSEAQPAELAAVLTPPGNDRLADWDPNKQFRRDNWFFQVALKSTLDLSPSTHIVSITSYDRYHQAQLLDTDGTDAEANDVTQDGYIRSFNQELRLQGNFGRVKYVLGGSYAHDSIYENTLFIVGDGSQAHFDPPLSFRIGRTHSNQTAETGAVFGNVDYDILPGLTAQGGLRFTKQTRHFNGCLGDPGPIGGGQWAAVFSNIYGFTIPIGGCTTFNPATNTVGPYSAHSSEHNLSWRGALNYKVARDVLIYGSVSKGYKQGSYPNVGASSTDQYAPAKQESLLAYEVGAKLGLLDRKLQLNGAAFYYDYRNKQLRGKFFSPFFGTIEKLFNIPRSRVYGFEFQALAAPTRGLSLQGNVTYANSKILSNFPSLSPIGVPINLQGETFELTPKWSGNASVDYDRSLSERLNGFVGIEMNFQSRQHGGYGGDPLFTIDPYTLLDLRAGIRDPQDKWRAQLWIRNLTDKYYWTNANYLGEFTYRQTGMPRTYGVSVSYRY